MLTLPLECRSLNRGADDTLLLCALQHNEHSSSLDTSGAFSYDVFYPIPPHLQRRCLKNPLGGEMIALRTH